MRQTKKLENRGLTSANARRVTESPSAVNFSIDISIVSSPLFLFSTSAVNMSQHTDCNAEGTHLGKQWKELIVG